MEVVKTSRGYAVVGDDRKVISLHQDPGEAQQALVEAMQAAEGAPQTPAAPPYQGPLQGVLERSRGRSVGAGGPQTALDEPVPTVEIVGRREERPRIVVHQQGAAHVVLKDGEEVGRFDNPDDALEHANLHKYAWSRGIDLGSNVPKDAPPLPVMAKGQTGEAEEELGVTKRLEDPYYGTTPETRAVGPYKTPRPPE